MQTIVSAIEMILFKLQSSFVAERECYYEEDCRLPLAVGKGSVLGPNRFTGASLRPLRRIDARASSIVRSFVTEARTLGVDDGSPADVQL